MTSPLPTAGAVLFDMDGVLVDSTTAHVGAWERFLADHGLRPPSAGIQSLFGRRASEAVAALLGVEAGSEVARDALEVLETYADALLGEYEPGELLVPGADAVVARLAGNGWRLAVATSARRHVAERSLGPLADRFEAVITAEDVSRGKPDPEVYRTAAERVGTPPGSCVVVEDAVAGVEAGVAAGMRVIAVDSTATVAQLEAAGACVVVDHVDAVSALLEGRVTG